VSLAQLRRGTSRVAKTHLSSSVREMLKSVRTNDQHRQDTYAAASGNLHFNLSALAQQYGQLRCWFRAHVKQSRDL
jgi:hypothetical protein